jgi:hypothetical protein
LRHVGHEETVQTDMNGTQWHNAPMPCVYAHTLQLSGRWCVSGALCQKMKPCLAITRIGSFIAWETWMRHSGLCSSRCCGMCGITTTNWHTKRNHPWWFPR